MHPAATPVVRGGEHASESAGPPSLVETRRTPTAAKRAALVGWLALSGYAALKAHWALGGTMGVTDVAEWRSFLATLTPTQFFLAFWGTVAIDTIGAALLHALLRPRERGLGRGIARRIVRIMAVAGALVMGTVALASLVMTAGPLLGLWTDPDAFPLAPWVGLFVYSCFALFALSLAATTWLTREAAKPRSGGPGNGYPPPPAWARRAAHLVALTALPSGLWRLALAMGFHAGYTEQGYAALDVSTTGALSLVTLSVVTEAFALLTLGLVRPWAERVPGWIPFVGGWRVHPMVAVVPAAIGVAILLGLWSPLLFWWTLPHDDMTATGATVVGLLYLPLVAWAPLLAAVTVDYHRRHRASAQPLSPSPR